MDSVSPEGSDKSWTDMGLTNHRSDYVGHTIYNWIGRTGPDEDGPVVAHGLQHRIIEFDGARNEQRGVTRLRRHFASGDDDESLRL